MAPLSHSLIPRSLSRMKGELEAGVHPSCLKRSLTYSPLTFLQAEPAVSGVIKNAIDQYGSNLSTRVAVDDSVAPKPRLNDWGVVTVLAGPKALIAFGST